MPSLALEVQRGGIPGQPGATPSQVGLICSSEPVLCPSMSLLVYRRLGDTNLEQSRLSRVLGAIVGYSIGFVIVYFITKTLLKHYFNGKPCNTSTVPPPNGAISILGKSHVFPMPRKRRGKVGESMVYIRRHDLWSPRGYHTARSSIPCGLAY